MAPQGRTIVSEPGEIRVSDPALRVEYRVYGNCPVQAFGTVGGRELYFRARHEAWSFEVADHKGRLPSDGGMTDSDGFYREGDHANAGWMPLEDAVRIIDECLREYHDAADENRNDVSQDAR